MKFEKENQEDTTSMTMLTLIIIAFSGIGTFLTGYNLSALSGSVILLKKEFNLDDFWHMAIVSIGVGTAAVSALGGGYVCDLLGRRPVIMLSSAMFFIGSLILACAGAKKALLVGQIFVGFGAELEAHLASSSVDKGLTTSSAPPYMAEISPSYARGRLMAVTGACFAFGTSLSGIVAGIFSYYSWGWRCIFGVSAGPAILQFFGFLFLPESPRWLIKKERNGKAKVILEKLHGKHLAAKEYEDIMYSEVEHRRHLEQELNDSFQTGEPDRASYSAIFCYKIICWQVEASEKFYY
ncbi:proton myo-inositol cotransporter-like [Amphiura filiformis]|uniref:proton myo-inositol cotransporter-like n=1 Tax=Amphiura filiformis TaxID=82378 RepID=UPI003B213D98